MLSWAFMRKTPPARTLPLILQLPLPSHATAGHGGMRASNFSAREIDRAQRAVVGAVASSEVAPPWSVLGAQLHVCKRDVVHVAARPLEQARIRIVAIRHI